MYELGNDYKFPSPKLATNEGIVAIGGDLNPLIILEAYKNGIWITSGLKKSFIKLHEMGHAHSVEVWHQNVIIGGLYGLDLGNIFCGESMFSAKPNASKVALYFLCKELKSNYYKFIDCQVPSEHLRSLGAEEISRNSFLEKLVN